MAKNGDTHNWQKHRKFEELMHHGEEQKKDADKMKHFDNIYEKTSKFYGKAMPDKETFFLIFCRTWINSHTVHTSAGHEVGMAIDLGESIYQNHSIIQ